MDTISCLHVPPLYERDDTFVFWDSVPQAQRYTLECSADLPFVLAEAGVEWAFFDDLARTWAELGNSASWGEIEAASARGRPWQTVDGYSLSWADFEQKQFSWNAINQLPLDLTVYSGTGVAVPGPERHLAWIEADGLQLTWAEFGAKQLTWADIPTLYTEGLSWDSLQARYLEWDDMDSRQLAWDDFDALPPDVETHRGCTAGVPTGSRALWFRVRAHDATSASGSLSTTRQVVLSAGDTETEVFAQEPLRLQIDGGRVRDFEGVRFMLAYDAAYLRLERLVILANGMPVALPRLVRMAPGRVEFTCALAISPQALWYGLVAESEFTGLKNGTTAVSLERCSSTGRQVI